MSRTIFLLAGFLLVACSVSAIPGGWEDVDEWDADVMTAAIEAADSLSEIFNSHYHHKLAKILKAKQQIVNGVNYKMDVIVGMTTCKKNEMDVTRADECDFMDNGSTYKKCNVVVHRDLKGNHKLVSSGCILASKKDL